jgi:hypothetical protein
MEIRNRCVPRSAFHSVRSFVMRRAVLLACTALMGVGVASAISGQRTIHPHPVIDDPSQKALCLEGGEEEVDEHASQDVSLKSSVVANIYSDDAGRTWLAGEIVAGETDPLVNPSESMAVELADGQVLMGLRNESPKHRRAFSISPSGIGGWSKPGFSDSLVEPICLASLCRLSWPTFVCPPTPMSVAAASPKWELCSQITALDPAP